MTASYLNLLSPDARVIIAGFVLDDRNDSKMYCPVTMALVLHENSPFSHDLSTLFPKLKISGHGDLCSGTVRMLWGSQRSVRALERIGGVLSELYGDMKRDLHEWYVPLVPFCSNLKFLCLDVANDAEFAWQEVVSNASHSLKTLKLVGLGTDAEKVKLKANFPQLKSVKLSGGFSTGNRSSFQVLDLLLEALGKTVETVSITSTLWWNIEDDERVCTTIRSHCPNLNDFADLSGNLSFPVYRALLEHYGPRVQRARLSGHRCNLREYREILDACPNLLFSDGLHVHGEHSPFLPITASRLREATIRVTHKAFGAADADTLSSCLKQMERVSKLSLHIRHGQPNSTPSRILGSLAETQLPRLEGFEFRCGDLDGTVLRSFLPVMPKLAQLTLFVGKISNEAAFLEICAAGVNLKELHVRIEAQIRPSRRARRRPSPKDISIFQKAITEIRKHPLLQRVSFTGVGNGSRASVRESVQCLRHRRVVVKFGLNTFLYGKLVSGDGRFETLA